MSYTYSEHRHTTFTPEGQAVYRWTGRGRL